MPRAVTRFGDLSTGHTIGMCSWPPTELISEKVPTVIVNNLVIGVVTDEYILHVGIPCYIIHGKGPDRAIAEGSATVFAGPMRLPVGRIGDPITCGDFVAEGSTNVFCGG